eukprot:CAMPEP_0172302312 /NCGR_PEP_ID=MMETSP1058-20130122/4033_1 /TAXON_ID=83371 /ORGANISM="Detonula confervacea, Strain CCMP 353" /LENGTH=822 /DNA_ID=CAMNT_0013012737 /DNA_START=87 /DNA_END=2555 /DNA_ORIENTATION=-
MPRHHQRKRARKRRPSAASCASLAIIAAALLTNGSPCDFVAYATGTGSGDSSSSSWDTKTSRKDRRTRPAAGSVRGLGGDGNNGKVNLLVKYKDSLAHTRSLEYNSGNSTWQSHTSISTVSEERHIAAVEIDGTKEDVGAIVDEIMDDEDVDFVEEDFIMYKYNPYNNNRIDESSKSKEELQNLRHTNRYLTTQQQQQNSTVLTDERTLMESQQYGIALTQAASVWALVKSKPNKYSNNNPIKVCIVDTGYDGGHVDLPKSGITMTETDYGDPMTDGDGHGTHCAGVIGALGNNNRGIVGVNPDPTKFSFHISKALNDDGMGKASSVLKGIEGCIKAGSKIISMSIGGGPKSQIFGDIYEDAYDQGVLVFAAAGNVGKLQDDYPASYPHVVSVGAVDKDSIRASFSNWNSQLELMAPGVDIVSTYPGNSYHRLSGTSMATPYVAGVAALVWGYFPRCSNQQIRNVLALSAKSMVASASGCNRRTGFGMVHAKDAFDLLDEYGCAAGGKDFSPPSEGGVGGCDQPLADLSNVPALQQASVSNGSSGNACQRLSLKLLTDDEAYEISWKLIRADDGEELNSGPPAGRNFEDKTEYNGPASGCLGPGTYKFIIYDKWGDGIQEPGHYAITFNEQILNSNSNFGYSETTQFKIGDSSSPLGVLQPIWTSILNENFSNGLGKFNDGGDDAMYLSSKFGRNGLVMIKSGSDNYDEASIYSNNISLNNRGYTKFKVVFSFYGAGMEIGDRFCLDYKANGASKWIKAKCWRSGQNFDFEDGMWNDNTDSVFRPTAIITNSISIRFRGFSEENFDRVFIDKIQLFGHVELV